MVTWHEIEWVGVSGGLLLGAVVVVCVLSWFLRELWALVWMGSRLRRDFGDNPVGLFKILLHKSRRGFSELQLRQAIMEHHLDLAIFITSPEGRCTWANSTLAKLFDSDEDSMAGFGWLRCIEEREKVLAEWKFSVEHGVPYESEYHILSRDRAARRRCRASAWAAKVDDVIVCYVGVVRALSDWETTSSDERI